MAVASAESDEAPLSLEISIADRAPQRLGQGMYNNIVGASHTFLAHA